MPLQNRVLPTGEIVADPARGLFTGNRGILHNDQKQLGRARWKTKAWITCALQFKDRHRQVMSPGSWTELFFLDEAVALSAGHRPCAECRRAAFNAYRAAWGGAPLAPEMDAALHTARLNPAHRWAPCTDLPDGAFVVLQDAAHLVWGNALHRYAPAGYGPAQPCPQTPVRILTPGPNLQVLQQGYRPQISPLSA